jgi:hypothetical protein
VPQPELLKEVLGLLKENHIDYMVSGSIVSSIQGEPRATHDVDIVVNLNVSAIPSLIDAFQPPRYYLSDTSIEEAIHHKSMFNLLDTTEGDKVDFWILTHEAFDQSRFSRKTEQEIFGIKMKVSTPEDTILMKLKWANLSGGSEKQFTDALRVFEVQYDTLNFSYIDKWIGYLEVSGLYERLKGQAEPLR